MRRGTTPTITLTVTNADGTPCDLTEASNYVTLQEVGTEHELTKSGNDLEVSTSGDATVIAITLTQAETLAFGANRKVNIQVRSKLGDVVTASEIASFNVGEILLDGEI